MTLPHSPRPRTPLRRSVVLVAGLCALAVGAAWTGIARRVAATPAVAGLTEVEGIYPTAAALPANLLRLYVVFSAPMRIGESNAHLHLLDEAGREVDKAFLQLEEELWDPTRRRLTVLLDPGRVKRGLRANRESGAPLVEGRRYRLVIDAGWRDGDGHPLRTRSVKVFEAIAPDRTAPDVRAWVLTPPVSGSRDPLVVRFPEPLDRALLAHRLEVRDGSGERARGDVSVGQNEREWSLTPREPWAAGDYTLRVSTDLEDVAGNSLRRVFDVDLAAARAPETEPAPPDQTKEHVRGFTVLPRPAT